MTGAFPCFQYMDEVHTLGIIIFNYHFAFFWCIVKGFDCGLDCLVLLVIHGGLRKLRFKVGYDKIFIILPLTELVDWFSERTCTTYIPHCQLCDTTTFWPWFKRFFIVFAILRAWALLNTFMCVSYAGDAVIAEGMR